MIRAHEKLIAWRAGILSVLVHCILLAILLISFNWKAVQPASIAQVELWDSLPAETAVAKPITPKPEPKPEPQPEPKPLPPPETKPEPKPAPEPEPKADIQVKKEPVKEAKPAEKPKPDPAIKARQEEQKRKEAQKLKEEQKLKEAQKREQEEKRKQDQQRKLAELQKMIAEENKEQQQERQAAAEAAAQSAAASAASASEVSKYIGLISNKIRRNVNKQLCGSGKPELTFGIALMPTGEVIGTPKIIKSSGIPACDQAVERAILQAQPLPLPTQPELFSQFRNLNLVFSPNGDN